MWSRANLFGALAFIAVAAAAPALPPWLVSLATIAFANALVVLGLVILWRAGLVPFGQALFYATGAYAVALLSRYAGWRDVFLLIAAGAAAAGIVAFLVGFLLARYRDIFFAMLSLAMSMILYGVLVKTETLGSTDGFHVESGTFLGYEPRGRALNLALFWLVLGLSAVSAFAHHALFPHGRRRARNAGARQRDPFGIPRHLGHPPHPPQAGDFRDTRRPRGRARGAGGGACGSQHGVLDDLGRLRVRHHSRRRGLGRSRLRGLPGVRDWFARSPSISCPASGSSSSVRLCC